MKNPNPMQKSPIHGASQKTWRGDVHPKMKRPATKNIPPIIMGGRRASGTALLPLALNLRM